MDQIRNGATVDGALWKGFDKPTIVQRVGAFTFGMAFLILATSLVMIVHERTAWPATLPEDLVALFCAAIGIKITFNAFRKNRRKA